MLKQSPNRNQRTKSFRVKQGIKVFMLIVFSIWLLYQLKRSSDKKSLEGSSARIFEKLKSGHETQKLGRKGFQPWIKKPYELIDETKEIELEMVKEQSSGGDDDIIGHDRGGRVEEEEPDEVEDLIDEEDNKEEEEENEDKDGDIMIKQMEENISLLEDQGNDEVERHTSKK